MAPLCGEEIGGDRASAGIIEFLRVRFRLALHGTDMLKSVSAPRVLSKLKSQASSILSRHFPSEKVLDAGSNLRWTVGDDSVIAL